MPSESSNLFVKKIDCGVSATLIGVVKMFTKKNYSAPIGRPLCFQHININIFAVYLLISILLTWPLIFNLDSTLLGGAGDTYGSIWGIWVDINGLRNSSFNNLIAAPFGQPILTLIHQPVSEGILVCFAKATNEVTAVNLFIILSFPLTAYATYLFLMYLLKNNLSAFVGGLIFGFCPGALMQVIGGHFAYAFNVFLPLFLLALYYHRDHRTVLSSFAVGFAYALICLNTLYFGYFALFIAFLIIVFDFSTLQDVTVRRFISGYVFAAFCGVILIIPFQYHVIHHQLTTSHYDLAKAGNIRNFSDLTTFSARPLEYLLPSINHPMLGRFLLNFSRDHLHGSNIFEQTLYLGVIPMTLCMTGFFLLIKMRDSASWHRYYYFFTLGALWMLFLSMPPFISLGSLKLPTVSYLMYKIAPMFRVYARFGILANFFMACAAAVVLSELAQRMSKVRYYLLLSALLLVLVFEYWSIPPNYAHSIDPPPVVYQWLAKEPGDFIIAEYPMMKSDEASFYTYLFWQRIHRKRMVNGASPDNQKAWDFYQRVNDLSDPETPQLLKSVGVKYIIVHKQMFREGDIPESLKRYYPSDVSARQYNDGKTPVNVLLPKPFKVYGDDIVYVLDRQL